MNSKISALLKSTILFSTICAIGCNPFGPFSNPVDPDSGIYQGFRTVETVEEITPAYPYNGVEGFLTYFVWDEAIDAAAYHLQIDTDPLFGAPIIDSNNLTTNSLTVILVDNGEYYWRVCGKNTAGQWGPWTAARSYQYTEAQWYDISPIDGDLYLGFAATLGWREIAGAQRYEVQTADFLPSEDDPVPDITFTNSHLMADEYLADRVYWRVRPIADIGLEGSWSNTFSYGVLYNLLYTFANSTIPADFTVVSGEGLWKTDAGNLTLENAQGEISLILYDPRYLNRAFTISFDLHFDPFFDTGNERLQFSHSSVTAVFSESDTSFSSTFAISAIPAEFDWYIYKNSDADIATIDNVSIEFEVVPPSSVRTIE